MGIRSYPLCLRRQRGKRHGLQAPGLAIPPPHTTSLHAKGGLEWHLGIPALDVKHFKTWGVGGEGGGGNMSRSPGSPKPPSLLDLKQIHTRNQSHSASTLSPRTSSVPGQVLFQVQGRKQGDGARLGLACRSPPRP